MTEALHHTNGSAECLSCAAKLMQADQDLVQWFYREVKPAFPDAHVSWSFRGEKDQNEAVAMGKSKLAWPNSKHNALGPDGKPCARAIDLFQLASNGMACWPWKWFKDIADVCADPMIEWGGSWTKFPDTPHFQLS
jgi:hypothetical protein